jgi:ubiquinone biosynthesis protein
MYVEMIFRDGIFHADPHPGNIYVLEDNKVGLLDFGKVGRIDEDTQDMIDDIVVAMMSHDPAGVCDGVIAMCDPPPTLDRKALQRDLDDWLQRYAAGGVADTDMAEAFDAADKILREHRLFVPSDVTLLVRTLTQLQGMLAETGYDVQVAEVLRPYSTKIAMKRFGPERIARHMQRTARQWEHLIDELPSQISSILEGVKSGRLEVPLEVKGLDRNVNRLVYATLAASLFSGSARMWASRVPPRVGDMSLPGAKKLNESETRQCHRPLPRRDPGRKRPRRR